MRLKTWTTDTVLVGPWIMSYKIDGINVRIDHLPFSKNEKVFSNLVDLATSIAPGVYEFYRNDWATSVSLLKNRGRKDEITPLDFYMLSPTLDLRLVPRTVMDPTAAFIESELQKAIIKKYEGLVLTNIYGTVGFKVKPVVTYDVRVLGTIEGKGKYNKESLGAVITTVGKVASGFTKQQRKDYWNDSTFVGSIIEVMCTELTAGGAMRHARFIRRRDDKNDENFEGLG